MKTYQILTLGSISGPYLSNAYTGHEVTDEQSENLLTYLSTINTHPIRIKYSAILSCENSPKDNRTLIELTDNFNHLNI